jgi:site-specific recombinase XerD
VSTKKLPKTLTKEEVLRLLSQPNKKAPTGLRNRCIMQLMYRAGLRESEVINLGPRDVEAVASRSHQNRTNTKSNNR